MLSNDAVTSSGAIGLPVSAPIRSATSFSASARCLVIDEVERLHVTRQERLDDIRVLLEIVLAHDAGSSSRTRRPATGRARPRAPCRLPRRSRRVAHGSGTHAPWIWSSWKAWSVIALSCGQDRHVATAGGVGLETLLLEVAAQRDVLGVAELRRRDRLALEVLRLLDVGLHHEIRAARCDAGDHLDRTVGLLERRDRRVGPDVRDVERVGEERGDRRRPRVEDRTSRAWCCRASSSKKPSSSPTSAGAWVTLSK